MLEARRYRGAAAYLEDRLADEEGVRYRSAPIPPMFRRALEEAPDEDGPARYDPAVLGQALGGLLRMPPAISLRHMGTPRVTVGERLVRLRELLRRGRFDFDEAVRGADRMTVAVTLFALLELYKRGEASWEQDAPFAPIAVSAIGAGAAEPRVGVAAGTPEVT
jgi:segregation and condensation protein A